MVEGECLSQWLVSWSASILKTVIPSLWASSHHQIIQRINILGLFLSGLPKRSPIFVFPLSIVYFFFWPVGAWPSHGRAWWPKIDQRFSDEPRENTAAHCQASMLTLGGVIPEVKPLKLHQGSSKMGSQPSFFSVSFLCCKSDQIASARHEDEVSDYLYSAI